MLRRQLYPIAVAVAWVGLHFVTTTVSWREVLGIGIICLALALMSEASRYNQEGM